MNLSSEAIRAFDFIIAFKKDNDGVSPTLAEICDACGISSKSVASYRLDELAGVGMIERIKKMRGIKVIGGEWTYKEPIRSTLFRARVDTKLVPLKDFKVTMTGEIENESN